MKKIFAGRALCSVGQTAIEYMLLLTICALIVFAAFKTFFGPSGRVRNATEIYFNKVSNGVMGSAPNIN